MKIYIVYDTDQDDGTTFFHVASSRERAEEWVDRHSEMFNKVGGVYYFPNIEEIKVDQEEKLCI